VRSILVRAAVLIVVEQLQRVPAPQGEQHRLGAYKQSGGDDPYTFIAASVDAAAARYVR
jgi:hypothetical protein